MQKQHQIEGLLFRVDSADFRAESFFVYIHHWISIFLEIAIHLKKGASRTTGTGGRVQAFSACAAAAARRPAAGKRKTARRGLRRPYRAVLRRKKPFA